MNQTHPASAPTRAGSMTSTMRAIPMAAGTKVLRVGRVEGGRVVDERLVRDATSVTVGSSEKNVFVLRARDAPPRFPLFERTRAGYRLRLLPGMSGRVAAGGRIVDLAVMAASLSAEARADEKHSSLELGTDARGRVVIGETAFLFHFAVPPPVVTRPALPLAVRTSTDIDWTITIIAAFSFLFHFGIVGAIYSDWMDPIDETNIAVADLIDAVKALPPAPPVDEETAKNDDVATTAAAVTAAPADKKSTRAPGAAAAHSAPAGHQRMADARAAAISSELGRLDVEMLGVINANGAATDRVLDKSEVATTLLDDAARSNGGAGRSIAGLDLGSDGHFRGRPGDRGGDSLVTIAHDGSADGRPTSGEAVRPKGPVGGNVGVTFSDPGGDLPGAGAVVAGMTPGFRRCYNRELPDHPDMKGTVRITAKIGPNGGVLSASPSGGGSLTGSVIACVVARVSSAQFPPPSAGGATIVIPVTFLPGQ